MHPISNLAGTLLPPVAPHLLPDPTTRIGKEHLLRLLHGVLWYCVGLGVQARKELQVCDSSPPDPKSQSPMRFSYYPPNFSPSSTSVSPPPSTPSYTSQNIPSKKVDIPYLNSAFV